MSDEEIVAAIQNGNNDLFGEIINRYESKLTRYGRRFLGRDDDITDMVQDVFIKTYTHINSFKTTEKLSPWIYRIAHNTFINELRRQSKFHFSLFDLDTESLLPTLKAPEEADDEAFIKELKTTLESQLILLNPTDREILLLAYFEDLSYKEISDVLHITISSVGVRLSRAKNKLKKLLTANNYQI